MSLIKASDFTTWVSRLDTIRTNHFMGALEEVSPAIVVGSKFLGSQMEQLRNNVYSTYNNSNHLRQVLIDISGNFVIGQKAKFQTYTDFNNVLTTLENICHVDPCVINNICNDTAPCQNQCTTNSNNSNCSTNSTNSNYSDCNTCSTSSNSTYSMTSSGTTWDWNCSTSSNSTNSTNSNYSDCNTNNTNVINNNCTTICTNSIVNSTNANFGQCSTYAVNSNILPIETI